LKKKKKKFLNFFKKKKKKKTIFSTKALKSTFSSYPNNSLVFIPQSRSVSPSPQESSPRPQQKLNNKNDNITSTQLANFFYLQNIG